MIVLVGCALGLGLLLVAAPFLWPATAAVPDRHGPLARFRDRMTQAGLHAISMPTFVVVCVIVGVAVAATTFALVPVTALSVAAGAIALAVPILVVNWRARQRRRASRTVWPDVVDHLLSGVRSGLSLPDSIVALAHTGPPASREAFAEFERDYAATAHFGHSLDRLKSALADPVADRILETLRMSRDVGGSELPSVLRSLSRYLREDVVIRGEVEARQSWVMNAAKLGAAAPWVVLVLLATRPEAAAAYNTPTGVALIVGGLAVTVVAYRVMLALARLPEERRWFG